MIKLGDSFQLLDTHSHLLSNIINNTGISKNDTTSAISIMDLARLTSILPDDIIATLITLNILRKITPPPPPTTTNNSNSNLNVIDGSGNVEYIPLDKHVVLNASGAFGDHDSNSNNNTNSTSSNNNRNSLALSQSNDLINYVIYAPNEYIDHLITKYSPSPTLNINGGFGILIVNSDYLQWTPLYVVDYKKDKWSIRGKLEYHASHPLL
jgi:hypothetical protein